MINIRALADNLQPTTYTRAIEDVEATISKVVDSGHPADFKRSILRSDFKDSVAGDVLFSE